MAKAARLDKNLHPNELKWNKMFALNVGEKPTAITISKDCSRNLESNLSLLFWGVPIQIQRNLMSWFWKSYELTKDGLIMRIQHLGIWAYEMRMCICQFWRNWANQANFFSATRKNIGKGNLWNMNANTTNYANFCHFS